MKHIKEIIKQEYWWLNIQQIKQKFKQNIIEAYKQANM